MTTGLLVICNRCGNRYRSPRKGGCPNCRGVEVSLTGKAAAECRRDAKIERKKDKPKLKTERTRNQ